MAERLDRSHATLKFVVIALAALIVVGFALVVTEIVRRLSHLDENRTAIGFDLREVTVPAGCILADAVAAGERLVLRFEPAKACPELVVVDPRTGAEVGRIRPVPAP